MSNSFWEKLKKGMGIDEVKIEEEPVRKVPAEKTKTKIKETKKEVVSKKINSLKEKRESAAEKEGEEKKISQEKEDWLESEGQLVVDLYQTEEDLFLQAPIAGVKAEDLDIEIEKDTLSIRGERVRPSLEGADYFLKECYWGKFSRQIILPVEIDPNRIEAFLKEGILTIKMPKLLKEKKRKIIPKE